MKREENSILRSCVRDGEPFNPTAPPHPAKAAPLWAAPHAGAYPVGGRFRDALLIPHTAYSRLAAMFALPLNGGIRKQLPGNDLNPGTGSPTGKPRK